MPYYGKYPNYFDLWLKTAGYNKTIDFYIITNIEDSKSFPDNVHVIKMEFNALKKRIQNLFNFEIVLSDPYKLCDYKPAYGLIFEDILKKYNFWGYCDPDIIWGDLRVFITESILSNYEKIYSRGHLTLYKNNVENNIMFKQEHKIRAYSYQEAFTTNYICHFDEWGGISSMYKSKDVSFYDIIDFADIRYQIYQFELAPPVKIDGKNKIFIWDNGKLFGHVLDKNNIIEKEYSYIHLQKRPMKYDKSSLGGPFIITPDEFMPFNETITKECIIRYSPKKFVYYDYLKVRSKMVWRQLLAGAVKQRFAQLLKRIKGYPFFKTTN